MAILQRKQWPMLKWQLRPCVPLYRVHLSLAIITMVRGAQRHTQAQTSCNPVALSSMQRPTDDMGRVFSQAHDSFVATSKMWALELGSGEALVGSSYPWYIPGAQACRGRLVVALLPCSECLFHHWVLCIMHVKGEELANKI